MDEEMMRKSLESAEKILDKIGDSVEEMDLSGLTDSIRESVDFIRKEAEEGYKNFKIAASEEQKKYSRHYETPYERYQAIRKDAPKEHAVLKEDSAIVKKNKKRRSVFRSIPGKTGGPFQKALSICDLIIFGGFSISFGVASLLAGSIVPALGVTIPLTLAGIALYVHGNQVSKRAKRLISYDRPLQEKDYIMLKELSEVSGEPVEQIVKDMEYVIENHLIAGMTMDERKTCLLFTDEARQQYEQAEESRIRRELEELQQKIEQEELERKKAEGTKEERAWIAFSEAMNAFFEQLQYHKQEIDNPSMREQMEAVELILSQISVCVKEHPDMISGTGHLISYYLPCMNKLLKTYEDLEEQPIQGDNIRKTQKEIEDSFVTIHSALTNMYDEMFRDVSMDISSDIQVLKAMMAQDGWQESGLKGSSF